MGTPSNSGRAGVGTIHRLCAAILLATVFLVVGLVAADPGATSSVGTGYTGADLVEVRWTAEHLSYEGPAELQKVGVMVVDFILAISGQAEPECDLGYGSQIDPYRTYCADRFRSGLVAMSARCDRMWKPVGLGSAGGPRRSVTVDRSRRPQADADRQITAP